MTLIRQLVLAAPIPQKFKDPSVIRPLASVLEQVLLSASNFIIAIVVVALSGIEAFGIFSVVLVVANYVKGLFATLFQRQMVLAIASKPAGTQKGVLFSTLAMQFLPAALIFPACALLGAWLSHATSISNANLLMMCVASYIFAGSTFELFKQYLYAINQQVFSLECTITVVVVQVLGLGALFLLKDSNLSVFWFFLILTIAFFTGVLINRVCIKVLRSKNWNGWRYTISKFYSYWKHARFSVVGMSVTWIQNQSVTPLLLILTNPLIVGYFSFGRLMVMPLAVINQGLINNSTPELRRLALNQSPTVVNSRLRKWANINLLISAVYVLLLGLGHFTGLFTKLIPNYTDIEWFLAFWVVSLIFIIQRFWFSQFFVVHLRFKFLLYASAFVAALSMTGMVLTGLLTDSVLLPLMCFVAGEILFIFILWREKSSDLKKSQPASSRPT